MFPERWEMIIFVGREGRKQMKPDSSNVTKSDQSDAQNDQRMFVPSLQTLLLQVWLFVTWP